MTANRPAGLNRTLLTLTGLVLLLGGAYVVTRGSGLIPAIGPLPAQDPTAALLPTGTTVQPWVPYAVIVAAAVIGVLCLLWLAAQIGRRRERGRTWRLGGDPGRGTTLIDADTAAAAFADEVGAYPGVQRAGAAITGSRTEPLLHLTLTTTGDGHVADLRTRIDTEALPRLRAALELDDLPAEVLVRLGTAPAAHRAR
jgi:hypothetical protein